jgi:uncharacterized membrane protein
MTLYNAIRHPHVHIRHHRHPARHQGGQAGFNDRLAAWITTKVGSMWTVYLCLAITVVWMALGSRAVLGFDPYPGTGCSSCPRCAGVQQAAGR